MRKTITAAAAAAVVLLGGGHAYAQDEFGSQGTFAFGIERAFGVYITEYDLDNGFREDNSSSTNFGLLMGAYPNRSGTAGGRGAASIYAIPRVGVDYFVIDHLSLGGSLAFASWHQEHEARRLDCPPAPPQQCVTNNSFDHDTSAWLLAPRVGYAVMFTDVFGIWPRGGITYYNANDDFNDPNQNDISEDQWALTLEFQLILSPVDHVGITVGPAIDFGFAGERDREDPNDPDDDLRVRSFGIAVAGLFGWI